MVGTAVVAARLSARHPAQTSQDATSFGDAAVAYEGCRDGCESEEVLGFAFVAAVEASASRQPGHRAFYDPTVSAQVLGGLRAPASDAVADLPKGEPAPQVGVVVAFVAVELGGPSASGAAAGADGRDTAN